MDKNEVINIALGCDISPGDIKKKLSLTDTENIIVMILESNGIERCSMCNVWTDVDQLNDENICVNCAI